MGGCASKPKDLDTQEAPAPVENPQDKAQETSETKTEEPLVDLSEEAPKVEEAAAETTKPVEEAAAASSQEEKEEAEPESTTEEATNSVEEKKAEEPEIKEDEKDTEAAAPKPQDN